VDIHIAALGKQVCPVRAMVEFMKLRKNLGMQPTSPLFALPGGYPLTRCVFTHWFDGVLSVLNLDSNKIRPHSFRIGACTQAVAANIPDHTIQILGRWKSECFKTYIRTEPCVLYNAQVSMSKTCAK